ncbi:hypothetical protein FHU38_002287 [Saccharomonospora amisosensis]|uniref:Uncharacterized protein n=1 Tax=Saccharomonospora amisosensis TaxID=1128677 RepID=A0A7X5UPP6_9PSEU|nr:hypothetical protein [Saccharomonospora amisosensis]NIJ11943.1 hypothetical protein [Saccharomonospora amisosensis]
MSTSTVGYDSVVPVPSRCRPGDVLGIGHLPHDVEGPVSPSSALRQGGYPFDQLRALSATCPRSRPRVG